MKKRCQRCHELLDSSSFNGSRKEPDGLSRTCSACVNRRRRELHAARAAESAPARRPRLSYLIKKGYLAALKKNRSLINDANRDRLLAIGVRDYKRAPKKPSHVEIVNFLLKLGAKPDFHLVCAATVGPHLDIMNALLEAGAEQKTAERVGVLERMSIARTAFNR